MNHDPIERDRQRGEEKNRQNFAENKLDNKLYPNIIDPNFTLKLTQKKEFLDSKLYSKKNLTENLEEEADKLCNPNFEFELEPHQMFIKNFMSFQTPYNSLLVFHGLGTGKTCSAIGVAEEMRSYYKQLGIKPMLIYHNKSNHIISYYNMACIIISIVFYY